ncbi:alpha/beta-hydrolase [Pluteus cervinus]|uniref:Alpha/beta-hydrolase n=1 Tax=Pluteus cervinus TaxID=181527 RepID=A0ACD3B447_9AGAR|nr:alpha/beta-hydrolase [Pluteus cervinus]
MSTSSQWPGISSRITSRQIIVGDLNMHILEALPPSNFTAPHRLVLLIHGFPELAYSWRKVIIPLADAGFHVIAPDQRGYGQTTTLDQFEAGVIRKVQYDDDLSPSRLINYVTDIVNLVFVLGYTSVHAVVGHDFGSPVAGNCALIRPDLFKSVVLMSAPQAGGSTLNPDGSLPAKSLIEIANGHLATFDPPRKHYTMYFSGREANEDITNPPGGLHAFLRAYYHSKSGSWPGNEPHPLPRESLPATLAGLAKLPHYYVLPLSQTMPQCVLTEEYTDQIDKSKEWLSDEELAIYVQEYGRTGFQGGLNQYRVMTSVMWSKEINLFAGKRIEVPAMFLSGKQDWGIYQLPGVLEKMKGEFCVDMKDEDFVLVDGAGHWVQQEKPTEVVQHLLRFFTKPLENI